MTFPTWPLEQRAYYTAYRAAEPIANDGHLDEPSWLAAPRSPRFRDMTHGGPAVPDTPAATSVAAEGESPELPPLPCTREPG